VRGEERARIQEKIRNLTLEAMHNFLSSPRKVNSVLSIDNLWMSTSSLAFKIGVWFILCLSLEYL
jgi:hypothetical protein